MKKQNILFWAAAVLIIATGIFIRYWQLDTVPPGIQYDEAYNGINALQAIETHDYKVFYPENFGREGFHLNVTAFFIKIFGAHNFSLRLANAMWGSLTVLGFFLLLRALKLSRFSVLMGTLMIAFSFWHLNFSRTAYRAIMVPLLLTWTFFFFFKGLRSKQYKLLYFALAGAVFGLGFHTYIAYRVAPMIVIVLSVALFLTKKDFLQKHWKSALVFIFSAFLVMLPILSYFISHKDDFNKRAGDVSVLSKDIEKKTGMTSGEAFVKSLTSHLGAFLVLGDHNQRHNHNNQPIIPIAWSVLLILGFAISFKEITHTAMNYVRLRKSSSSKIATRLFYPSLLGQSIFWIMLVPGVLSIEGIPHSLRIIGTIPGVFILCTLPFDYVSSIYQRLQNSQTFKLKPIRWNILRGSIIGLTIIVAVTGVMQGYLYFELWAKDGKTLGAFERKFFDLGLLVKQLPTKEHNYIITSSNVHVGQDHSYSSSSIKTAEYLGFPNIRKYQFYHPLDGRFDTNCGNTLIIFQESDKWLRDQYKFHCPELNAQEITPRGGVYSFWVMQ